MLWSFILTVVLAVKMSHCGDSSNLTEITWCHAVNSQKLLNDALKSEYTYSLEFKSRLQFHWEIPFLSRSFQLGDTKAIEADVIIGIHDSAQSLSNDAKIPIMGHPPATKSDLSLVEFLEAIKEYHSRPENVNKTKIVKLDFKSIEATEQSTELLKTDWKKVEQKHRKPFAVRNSTHFTHRIILILWFHSVCFSDLGKC